MRSAKPKNILFLGACDVSTLGWELHPEDAVPQASYFPLCVVLFKVCNILANLPCIVVT